MKETVTFNSFYQAFVKRGRAEAWTQNGLYALFQYIEEMESDLGEEIELDVIGLDGEFTEWKNIREYNKAYNTNYDESWEVSENCSFIDIDGDRFIAGEW